MSDEQIERTLRAVPLRSLPEQADAEIVAALRAVRRTPWYARRVALWQAAAACLVVGLVTWLAAKPAESPGVAAVEKPARAETVLVSLEQPLFPDAGSSAEGIDISNWQYRNGH